MRATVQLAKAHGVKVGAHPSLPDRQGFGRREMKIGRDELANCLIYQIGALKGFLEAEGMPLNHIKPHGSLYGMAARDPEVANAICDAADVFKAPLLGMIGTEHERVYTARGHRFLGRVSTSIWTTPTTASSSSPANTRRSIRARRRTAPCERYARAWRVPSAAKEIPVRADTICVHSDTPGAHLVAQAVHDRLVERGVHRARAPTQH